MATFEPLPFQRPSQSLDAPMQLCNQYIDDPQGSNALRPGSVDSSVMEIVVERPTDPHSTNQTSARQSANSYLNPGHISDTVQHTSQENVQATAASNEMVETVNSQICKFSPINLNQAASDVSF